MRRLVSLAAVSSLAAALLVPAAVAAPRELWPGVTYESGIQFTTHGPVAINVLRGPRPGGLTTLEPVLSNDTVVGREKLTTMEVRLRRTATAAGVNGDYFTLATGKPSGVLMREAQLVAPPNAGRASAGIRSDGVLDIRRVGFKGTWRATVGPRPLGALNAMPAANGAALYTDAYGASTPALPGSAAVILFPFPAATPEVDLVAPVVEARTDGGAVAIPAGGAVVVARGTAALPGSAGVLAPYASVYSAAPFAAGVALSAPSGRVPTVTRHVPLKATRRMSSTPSLRIPALARPAFGGATSCASRIRTPDGLPVASVK